MEGVWGEPSIWVQRIYFAWNLLCEVLKLLHYFVDSFSQFMLKKCYAQVKTQKYEAKMFHWESQDKLVFLKSSS